MATRTGTRSAATSLLIALLAAHGGAAETVVDPRTGRLAAVSSDIIVKAGAAAIEFGRFHDPKAAGILPGWTTNWDLAPGAGDPAWKLEFDSAGRLAARTDSNGNRLEAVRGPDGRLQRINGPFGAWLAFADDGAGTLTVTSSNRDRLVYRVRNGQLESVLGTDGRTVRYAYKGGLLAEVSGADELACAIEYDAQGRAIRRTWPDGSKETYAYESGATIHRDAFGMETRYAVAGNRMEVQQAGSLSVSESDAAGNVVYAKGPAGETRFAYDAAGNLVSSTDPEGTTAIAYDAAGRPAKVAYPDGTTETIERDAAGNPTVTKLNGTVVSEIAYGPGGLPVRIATPDGTRTIAYDAQGRTVSVANSLGDTTRYEYDDRGLLVRETNPAGGVAAFAYDAQGRIVSETDALGRTTKYAYNEQGRLEETTDPAGVATRYGYDARGRRAWSETNGKRTETSADPRSREVTTTHPGGGREIVRWGEDGKSLESVSPSGAWSYQEFDAAGRVAKLEALGAGAVQFRYDAQGRIASVEREGNADARYRYDAKGRLESEEVAGQGTRKWAYDADGRITAATDSAGQSTRFEYDPAGSLRQVASPGGMVSRWTRDSEGRLSEVTTPAGARVALRYDKLGNLAAVSRTGAGEKRSDYNAAGELVRTADAAGRSVAYEYDAAGRLAKVLPAAGPPIAYSYDADGRVAKLDDGAHPVAYEYDAAGRCTSVSWPAWGKKVSTAWNSKGQRTRLVASNGKAIEYAYDEGRISDITLPGGGVIGLVYSERGTLTNIGYPNGVEAVIGYTAAGRMESLELANADGETLARWTLANDAAGRPARIAESVGAKSQSFEYDADGRLAGPWKHSPAGQRTASGSTAYAYTGELLARAGDEEFVHDAAGFLSSRKSPMAQAAYAYDDFGRLARATRGMADVSFAYDAQGNLAVRRDARGETRRLTVDDHLFEELDSSGNTTAIYVHGPGTDWPLAVIRGDAVFCYHLDPLGNVALITDAAGTIAASYEYDAFGVLKSSRGNVPNPLLFAGREYDAPLGLYCFRARWYDPALGRFLTPDPDMGNLEHPQSLDPYVFAAASPTLYADPTGLSIIDHQYWQSRYGISPQDLSRLTQIALREQMTGGEHPDYPRNTPAGQHYYARRALQNVETALTRAEMMPDRLRRGPHLVRSATYQLNNPASSNILPPRPSTGYTPLTEGRGSPAPTRWQQFRGAVANAVNRVGNWFRPGGGDGGASGGAANPHGSGTRAMQAPSGGDTRAMQAPGSGGEGGAGAGAGSGSAGAGSGSAGGGFWRNILRGTGGSALGGGITGAIISGISSLVNGASPKDAAQSAAAGGVIGSIMGGIMNIANNGILAAAAGSTRPIVTALAPRAIPFLGAAMAGYGLGTAAGNWWHGNKPGDAQRVRDAEQQAAAAEAAAANLLNDPNRIAATAANVQKNVDDLKARRDAIAARLKKVETAAERAKTNGKIMDDWIAAGAKGVMKENPVLTVVQGPEGKPGLGRYIVDGGAAFKDLQPLREAVNTQAEGILKVFETQLEPPDSTPQLAAAVKQLASMGVEVNKLGTIVNRIAPAAEGIERCLAGADAHAAWVKDSRKIVADFNDDMKTIQDEANGIDSDAKAFDEKKAHVINMINGLMGRIPEAQRGLFAEPLGNVMSVALPDYSTALATHRQMLPAADKRVADARRVLDEIERAAKDEIDDAEQRIAANATAFDGAGVMDAHAGLRRASLNEVKEIDATWEAIKFVVMSRATKLREWISQGEQIKNVLGPKKIAEARAANDTATAAKAEALVKEASARNEADKQEAAVIDQAKAAVDDAQGKTAPMMNLLGVGGG